MNLTLKSHNFYADTLLLLYLLYSYIFFYQRIHISWFASDLVWRKSNSKYKISIFNKINFYLIENRKINFKT